MYFKCVVYQRNDGETLPHDCTCGLAKLDKKYTYKYVTHILKDKQ